MEGELTLFPAELPDPSAMGREELIERIRLRSGEAMLERFVREWIPLEDAYFERAGVRACCTFAF